LKEREEPKIPNWCSNSVTITHEDPAKIAALAEAMEKGRFLDHIIPVPQELKDAVANFETNEELVAKYGYSNWYDFCVSRWGTKWDVDCQGTIMLSDDGKTIDANFDSAWAPPTAVYDEMVEQGYDVVGYYYEPGMAFVGKWDNGCDDCYEYSGENSKTVRAVIGDELDDMFGISDSMADWEAENAEDEEDLTEWIKDGIEARQESAK